MNSDEFNSGREAFRAGVQLDGRTDEWADGWAFEWAISQQYARDQGTIAKNNANGPEDDRLPPETFHAGLIPAQADLAAQWLAIFDEVRTGQ